VNIIPAGKLKQMGAQFIVHCIKRVLASDAGNFMNLLLNEGPFRFLFQSLKSMRPGKMIS